MIVGRVLPILFLFAPCVLGSSTSGKSKKEKDLKAENETSIQGKIVGGQAVDITSIPYMVSVSKAPKEHFCGGSIVHAYYVLTAAHCVQGMSASSLFVRTGSTTVNSGGQVTAVSRIHIHPKYSSNTVESDVALLQLRTPITKGADDRKAKKKVAFNYDVALLELPCPIVFNKNTKIIRIADAEPQPGLWALVTGWGVGNEKSKNPMPTAQAIWMPTMHRSTCAKAYQLLNKVTNKMICAGYKNGGMDACQGDSGGPMVVGDRQAGVVSWGKGCARPGSPGIYANLADPEINQWVHTYIGRYAN